MNTLNSINSTVMILKGNYPKYKIAMIDLDSVIIPILEDIQDYKQHIKRTFGVK